MPKEALSAKRRENMPKEANRGEKKQYRLRNISYDHVFLLLTGVYFSMFGVNIIKGK